MKGSKYIISFGAFAICIFVVLGVYFIFYPSAKNTVIETKVVDKFSSVNYNLMQTDTFVHLIKKKYGESAIVKKNSRNVQVNISGANMKTQDFFNGNNRLLEFKMKEHGFEIKHAKNSKSISAQFKRKDGGVIVPNDVLINIAK